jgi:hypothetical protein
MNTTTKTYIIPVVWHVCANMVVEAENLAEAIEKADDMSLPTDTDYLEGTFEINRGFIPHVNENLTEAEIKDECYETF